MDLADMMNKDERPIRIIHQHPINLLPALLASLLAMLVALGGIYRLGLNGDSLNGKALSAGFLGFGALFALGLLIFIGGYRVYRQNKLVITNQNIFQMTQNGLLGSKIAQLNLAQVEDVSCAQTGILANVLGYGDITVETAAEEENFVFRTAPNPRTIVHLVTQLHNEVIEQRGTPTPG